jgi:hypothetical protein
MSLLERLRAALELVVVHFWTTAVLVMAARLLIPAPSDASDAVRGRGPHWCQQAVAPANEPSRPFALRQLWREQALAPDATYLVRAAAAGPCSPTHTPSTPLSQSIQDCGGELLVDAEPGEVCDVAAESPCALLRIAAKDLRSCVTVVSGPYDAAGEPAKGFPVAPYLTVLPGFSLSDLLFSFLDWRKELSGSFRPLAHFEGTAFSGWLVIPVLDLDISVDRLADAQHLFTRTAAAIGARPRPRPVLLDLGGLRTCPAVEALPRIIAEFEGIGLEVFGYGEFEADAESTGPAVNLSMDGEPYGLALSVRLSMAPRECASLPAVRPTDLPLVLASRLALERKFGEPLYLALHLPDTTVTERMLTETLQALEEVPGQVVVTLFRTPHAGEVRSVANGLQVLDMGLFFGEGNLLPAARRPSGWFLQCHRYPGGGTACATLPVAGVFGEPDLVTHAGSPSCHFLPADFPVPFGKCTPGGRR